MTAASKPASTGWRVTYQHDDIDTTVPGRLVRGITVGFTTGAGTASTVFIPAERYSDAGYVAAQIAAKAAQVDAVDNLSGQAAG